MQNILRHNMMSAKRPGFRYHTVLHQISMVANYRQLAGIRAVHSRNDIRDGLAQYSDTTSCFIR